MTEKQLEQRVYYTQYKDLLDKYHQEFPDLALLEKKARSYAAKASMMGWGKVEYIIYDEAVFLTQAPTKLEKFNVPDFVFGFATLREEDPKLLFPKDTHVFANITVNLEVNFNRPLVNILLNKESVNGVDTYTLDDESGYKFGMLFYGYEGIELTVENMEFGCIDGFSMFECRNLKKLSFKGKVNTKSMHHADSMFNRTKLKELILPEGFDTTSTKTMERMFANNLRLELLDLSQCKFDTWNTFRLGSMFSFCLRLKQLKLGRYFDMNMAKYESTGDITHMFKDCPGWRENFEELFPEAQRVQNAAGEIGYIVSQDLLDMIKNCIPDLSDMKFKVK